MTPIKRSNAPEIGPRQFVGYFFEPDPLLGWRMVPGRQGWFVKPPIRSWIQINQQGFRGPDFPAHQSEHTKRILLLADSFGVAIEVDEKDTFGRVLESQLNAGCSEGDGDYQVLNTSVGGYGTEQQLLFLQTYGAAYRPDVVLLAFHFGDDILENSLALRQLVHWRLVKLPRPYITFGTSGDQELQDLEPDPNQVRRAWERYYDLLPWDLSRKIYPDRHKNVLDRLASILRRSYDVLQNNWRKSKRRGDLPLDVQVFNQNPNPLFQKAWEHTGHLLLAMRDEVHGMGAQFLVSGLCTKEQVIPAFLSNRLAAHPRVKSDYDPLYPNRRLESFLAKINVPYLDLTSNFNAHQSEQTPVFFIHDLHWNEAGHRLAGKKLAEFILTQ